MNIKFQNLSSQSLKNRLFDAIILVSKDPIKILIRELAHKDEVPVSYINQGDMTEAVTSFSRFEQPSLSQVYKFFGNSFVVPIPGFYMTNVFHSGNRNPLFFKHEIEKGNPTDLVVFDQDGQPADSGSYTVINSTLYHNFFNKYSALKQDIEVVYIIQYVVGEVTYREVLKRDLIYSRATQHSDAYSKADLVYFSWIENGMTRVIVRNELDSNGVALMLNDSQALNLIDPTDTDKLESWALSVKSGFRRVQ